MRVPASLAAIPLLAGSAAGLLLYDSAPPSLPLCAAAAALVALLAGAAALADDARLECGVALGTGWLLAGLSLGVGAAGRVYAPPLLRWYESNPVSGAVMLEGVLREDATVSPFGASLLLDVRRAGPDGGTFASGRLRGGVRLTVAGTLAASRLPEWRGGRTVRATATLRAPARYHSPGVPDDRRALARRGIVLLGSVKSAALVEVVQRGSAVTEAAAASRAWARARLGTAVGEWSRRSSGIAAAILIGDRTGLSDEDERRLQEAGTYHVVAISGGNIAILTVLLLGLMRMLRVPGRVAAATAIGLLAFYGQIVVPSASVSRAITAATVYLAGRMLDQSGPALNVLAVAAVLALALQPVSAFDPAFLLSFGATLGILLGVPRLTTRARGLPGLQGHVVAVLAATVAAEIALAPIGATLFSRITFAGLVLNFAAIPLMTLVQAGSLLVLAVGTVSSDAALIAGRGVHLAAWGLVESARLVELAPWLSVSVAPPAWWVSTVYYAAVLAALTVARCVRPGCLTAACAALAILSGSRTAARDWVEAPPAQSLRIVFLDVGQGDSTVVILPDGRAMLVDAGGLAFAAPQDGQEATRFDIGTRVVVPALRALGVRRLDTLAITHGDPDHVGGAAGVLRQLRPRAIWEGVPVPPHEPLLALARAAAEQGAEWRNVQRGDLLRAAGVELRVLHPPPPDWERQRVRNEDSIVLEARYGRVSVVLPGDIGREGETAVASSFSPAPVVILKAPHHGSATSSTPEFLSRMRPRAVIFSAGRGNRFGHPAPSVVSRYRALGSAILSTADDGTVVVDTDGERVEIRSWLGSRMTLGGEPERR